MTRSTSTALLAFYTNTSPSAAGYWFDDIISWPDSRLEECHDYIQWIFPLPEPSMHQPDSPLLSEACLQAFVSDQALRKRVAAIFHRMLQFYGIGDAIAGSVDGCSANESKPRQWVTTRNHNYLRLTRILRFMTLIGFTSEAAFLLRELERIAFVFPREIGAEVQAYWRRAVRLE